MKRKTDLAQPDKNNMVSWREDFVEEGGPIPEEAVEEETQPREPWSLHMLLLAVDLCPLGERELQTECREQRMTFASSVCASDGSRAVCP
ncbi:hypothetical protein FQA47_014046 [Oryzias melastigma]|uniref:Uncharacterized protein n=1 Tax=Oryzias melastigma TaxID=30732 RepID=A0A834FM89_ORYME|nr:hypothetical protein FQA47_014046 [Oryzias melastigma]